MKEFTIKVSNVSYCDTLTLRIEPGNGSDTKRWNLDWVQVSFVDSSSYYMPYKDWVEQSSPTVTLPAAVGRDKEPRL